MRTIGVGQLQQDQSVRSVQRRVTTLWQQARDDLSLILLSVSKACFSFADTDLHILRGYTASLQYTLQLGQALVVIPPFLVRSLWQERHRQQIPFPAEHRVQSDLHGGARTMLPLLDSSPRPQCAV